LARKILTVPRCRTVQYQGDAKLTTRALPVQFRVDGLRGAHSELTYLPKSPPATPEAWDAKYPSAPKEAPATSESAASRLGQISPQRKKQRLNQLNHNPVSPLLSIHRCGISSRLQVQRVNPNATSKYFPAEDASKSSATGYSPQYAPQKLGDLEELDWGPAYENPKNPAEYLRINPRDGFYPA